MRGQKRGVGVHFSPQKKTLDYSRVTIMLCQLGYCAEVLSPELLEMFLLQSLVTLNY